jgi:hypothetical protein
MNTMDKVNDFCIFIKGSKCEAKPHCQDILFCSMIEEAAILRSFDENKVRTFENINLL